MTKDQNITNKDLYDAINTFRKEVQDTMEKTEIRCINRYKEIGVEVKDNTNWRNRITGQFAVITVVLGFAINWFFDQFQK